MSLSTLELNQLRLDTEDLLPDTCTIQTLTRTKDAIGGWSNTWANTYTSVVCRIWKVVSANQKGREPIVGDQPSEVTSWVMNVHWDQTLDNTMRVTHGGHTYEVNELNNDGTQLLHRRALLTRIE